LVDPKRLPACAKFVPKPWRPADMVSFVQRIAIRCHADAVASY